MAAPGLIDPTKTGNYPVILGDALLKNTSNEIFTGIKYNHKPVLSSDSAPNLARLKPSVPGKTTSYDLSYTDKDEKYAFAGTRNTAGGQYVLYFDPNREAFILDLVDSTFNMNITRLPGNTDPDSLRRQYPHIDNSSNIASKGNTKPEKSTADKPTTKARAKPSLQKKEVKRKPEKKQAPKNIALSLPVPLPAQPEKPAEPKKRTPAPEEEEDEDEDDDGGLLVEYPGADTSAARRTDFSPAFPSVRRFDEFMDQRESEGDDADGEEDDDPDFEFKLPSPVNNRGPYESVPDPMDVDVEEEGEGEELEVDLAKELEDAFENFENSQNESPDGDESEISEED
ncbi:ell-associated factor [Fusarium austroafricanum]|uniref:Ell-associated factor n=1 Tax=Fusarium austroafricanum TaxID=2364996 RepID=A0A8H4JK39_9HYPO|nr:ell-associated factor [Fusarium austroafricanum]